ncbi:uncharacterized protein Hap1MRO34_001835 [Clarias gariepinus]|uniref:uncharacterized protein LOC128515291 n=1 Tax=Clarias gariepinus TaxID=13013 RepID=UPI00234D223C|nr:uncharacterized protein LOC128515291 [Clarias gariepinus]
MAADLGWMSGHSAFLDMTIISILFLIAFITLYTLCTTCFSETPEGPEQKEIHSSLSLSVNVQEPWRTHRTMNSAGVLNSMAQSNMPQVPAEPQHKNQTIVYSQQDNVYSHNRDNSVTTRIPASPAFSVRSTASLSPEVGRPALPPIPPIFQMIQVEPLMAASSQQQPNTIKNITPPPEQQLNMNIGCTGTLSEEHPYACIGNVLFSGPSSPFPCNVADEKQWESESHYQMVTEYTESTTRDDLAILLPAIDSKKVEEFEFMDDQLVITTDKTAIYAAVNRKNKSQKSIKEGSVVQETMVLDEDEIPPVPEKIFD